MSGGISGCYNGGWHLANKGQDADEHPRMHRTALPAPSRKVKGAKAKQLVWGSTFLYLANARAQ